MTLTRKHVSPLNLQAVLFGAAAGATSALVLVPVAVAGVLAASRHTRHQACPTCTTHNASPARTADESHQQHPGDPQ